MERKSSGSSLRCGEGRGVAGDEVRNDMLRMMETGTMDPRFQSEARRRVGGGVQSGAHNDGGRGAGGGGDGNRARTGGSRTCGVKPKRVGFGRS